MILCPRFCFGRERIGLSELQRNSCLYILRGISVAKNSHSYCKRVVELDCKIFIRAWICNNLIHTNIRWLYRQVICLDSCQWRCCCSLYSTTLRWSRKTIEVSQRRRRNTCSALSPFAFTWFAKCLLVLLAITAAVALFIVLVAEISIIKLIEAAWLTLISGSVQIPHPVPVYSNWDVNKWYQQE